MAPSHPQTQPPEPTLPAPTLPTRASGPPSPPPAHLDEPAPIPPPTRRTGPVRETSPGVVLPLARSPIRTDDLRAGATPTPRYLGIGRLLRIASARGASSLYLTAERPSVHPGRRRDPAARDRAAARQGGSRSADPGDGARREPGGPCRRHQRRVGLRAARCRSRALRDLPRPARTWRRVPADSDAADLGRPARPVARHPVALRRARGPGPRRRPAAERQVDADFGIRRSHQPHPIGLHRQPRDRDQVRPREPAGDGQPARVARRARDDAARRQGGAAREPRRAGDRRLENARSWWLSRSTPPNRATS